MGVDTYECGEPSPGYCHRCHGDRWLVTCPDDLCGPNNVYGCMHGDSYRPCPACNPEGELSMPLSWNVVPLGAEDE